MTTIARLLTQKQQVLESLNDNPGPNERDELERLLQKINTALSLLEDGEGEAADDQRER